MILPDELKDLVSKIITVNHGALTVIQDIARLQTNMITADNVKALVDAVSALIAADVNDKKALADAQTLIATLKSSVVEFNDPALQSSVDSALAAATAATAPAATPTEPSATTPAPSPAPDTSTPPPETPAPTTPS